MEFEKKQEKRKSKEESEILSLHNEKNEDGIHGKILLNEMTKKIWKIYWRGNWTIKSQWHTRRNKGKMVGILKKKECRIRKKKTY